MALAILLGFAALLLADTGVAAAQEGLGGGAADGLPSPIGFEILGADERQTLYLELVIGTRSTGRIVDVYRYGGKIAVRKAALEEAGLSLPGDAAAGDETWIDLDRIPGLAYRYDAPSQTLFLQPPTVLLPTQRFGREDAIPVSVRRDPGVLFGYDVYAQRLGTFAIASAHHSARWFGEWGAATYAAVVSRGEESIGYRRLETSWTYSDTARMWTWTWGDLISAGLSWTRPVRIGGFQWRRNFGVRPDLITLPIPRIEGSAAVPGSIELYVNNVRQFTNPVQEGPYVVDVAPRVSGAGEASLVVIDHLGRVTRTEVPFYVDHRRLAQGLTDFSVETGFLRMGFGSPEDGYSRDPVLSASARHGLTHTVTLEAHGEMGSGVRMIGWGAIWAPANRWGMVAASVAFSGGWGRGSQYSAAYQWNRAGYGFDVMLVRSSPEFTVLADLDRGGQAAQPRRRSQMRGGLWMPIGTGSISAGWLGWREGEEPLREARTLSINQTYQGLTLSGSIFADEQWQAGAALTIGVPLGRRLHATGAATHDRDRSAVRTGLRRSAPYEGGWGWALQGDRLGEFRQAEAELRSRFSEGRLGVEQRNGETRAYLEASGSLVLMAGHFFPSRPIHDAFAVVSTGIRGVQVQIDNRAYGRTGPSGHLLIADLRSWDRNRIAIDTGDLGVGVRIGEVTSIATPADRGGVLVHFDLAEVHPAIVQLLGPDGEVVPPGSRTRRSDTGANVVVGFDGIVYLEDLSAGAVLDLEIDGVMCRYRLPDTGEPSAGIRHLGVVSCEVEPRLAL